MISAPEALQIIKENLPSWKKQKIPLIHAHSLILAEDVLAPEASPRFTNSAMDGFGVRWDDVEKTTANDPVELQIIGESRAGVPFDGVVKCGEAVRISTGAMLPGGADTVVRVEDTESLGNSVVKIIAVKKQGQDVRYAGEEFDVGAPLLLRGTPLKSKQLALLASVGIEKVIVFCRPKVSLLVTGTEVACRPGESLQPHQIRDSNSIMLQLAVKEAGGDLLSSGHVEDSLDETIEAIQGSFDSGADIILCSGGVSVGQHDHVKNAAAAVGFEQLFWRVRQKPGKPLFFARKQGVLLFGLPGNPVSAYMCFMLYVKPLIAGMLGINFESECISARLAEGMTNTGKRTNFVRVELVKDSEGVMHARQATHQGSHMLSSIVRADGYVILEPGQALAAGSDVQICLL